MNDRINLLQQQQQCQCPEQWAQYAPTEAPKTWFGINVLCFAYSVLLGCILGLASDDGGPREIMLAKHSYLIYDLLLCAIWVAEIGLTVLQHNMEKGQEQHSHAVFGFQTTIPWYVFAELVVAVYFCLSSVYFVFFRSWDRENPHDEQGPGEGDMWLDIIVNILAYIYVSVDLWKQLRHGTKAAIESDSAVETGAYGSLSADGTDTIIVS